MFSIRQDSFRFGALIALCIVLFFAWLGVRDIWDIDEGMHAAMAQTILQSGDWVTPVFNGEPFFDKPVMFNWLVALSFMVFGITEFAARFPAALAGLGCVVLTYLLGRKLYDATTGLLAGIILATSLEIILLSRTVQYDILFSFFTTLALYFFASGVVDNRRQYYLGFYIAAALAVLTKGPLGLFIPSLTVVAYLLLERRGSLLREMHIPLGGTLFLLIVIPWFLLMERANPGYLQYFIVKQHFGNFFGGEGIMQPRHPEPFYYYLPVLLGGLLPWSLMLPQAMWRGARQDRAAGRGLTLFLLAWTIGVFLFFSAATSKLSTYVLPLFPAAALLLGRYWREFLRQPDNKTRRGMLFGTGAAFCLLVPFAVYVLLENPWTYWKYRTGIEWLHVEIFMVAFTALFGLALLLLWLRRYRSGFMALSAISPFLAFYIVLVLAPGADPYKGSREIGIELAERLPPGEPLHFFGQLLDSAMFYTGRGAVMLNTEDELNDYLASGDRVYVLIRTRARRSADSFSGNYHVIRIIGNKAIVSNRPDS